MEKERKEAGLPALRYLVCVKGFLSYIQTAKVARHLTPLVSDCALLHSRGL